MLKLPDIQELDEDLIRLARHRLGFQSPGALTELNGLLSLAVVAHEAEPNDDVPEARVLALRSVLREVIERMENATTRQALRILFFLDDDPALQAATLSARRSAIVDRLPIGEEQWRRGVEDRFRAILAGELRSYELEHRLAGRAVLPPDTVAVRVVRTAPSLRRELSRIVDEARERIMCLGSRSREAGYLDRIVTRLAHDPALVHHRLLWGPPHHDVMVSHLHRLLALQAVPGNVEWIHVGLVWESSHEPERHVVTNEHEALLVIPPEQVGSFSSALITRDDALVGAIHNYVLDLTNYSQRVTAQVVAQLRPVHSPA